MSQIPSDQRAVTAVRQTRAASPTAGLAQSGIAISNTPTVQAVDSVSPIASQLAQVLSQAAGTVSQLGQQAELARYRESVRLEREARMSEAERKDADARAKDARDVVLKAQRGAGKSTLEVQLQLYQERLKSNSPEDLRRTLLSDVDEADKPQEMAQIIRGYLPPDTDESLATELVQDFVPRFVGAMAARDTQIRTQQQVNQADSMGSDNADSKVPVSEVWQSLDTFVRSSPLVTRDDAYSRVVRAPAAAAAEIGNVARVQEIYDNAPPEFKNDLLPLIDNARKAEQRIRNEQVDTIQDALGRAAVKYDAEGRSQFSPRSRLAFLDQAITDNPRIAGELIGMRTTLKDKIESDEKKYAEEATKREDERSIAQQQFYIQQFAADAVTNNDAAFFLQDQEVVRESDGNVVQTVNGKQLLKDSMQRQFAIIDSDQNIDPQTKTRQKLEKSRQLAYVDDSWSRSHASGYLAVSQASVQNTGGAFTVPEATREAVRLHLAMRDTYPNAVELHGDERLFYDRVVANMLNPNVGGNENVLDAAIAKAAVDSLTPVDATLSDQAKEIGLQLAEEASILPNIFLPIANTFLPSSLEFAPTSSLSTNFSNQGTLEQAAARRITELRLARHPNPEKEAERDLRARLINVKGFGFIMEEPIPKVGNMGPAQQLSKQIDALVELYGDVNRDADGNPMKDIHVMAVQDPISKYIRFFDYRTNSLVRTGSDDTGNDRFVAPLTVEELGRRSQNASELNIIAASARSRAGAQAVRQQRMNAIAQQMGGNRDAFPR
jgi:hypothetical protein